MVSMTDVASGSSALQYYTATFVGKWAVTEVTNAGRAGWLSTEANVQLGLSPASRTQTPQGTWAPSSTPTLRSSGPMAVGSPNWPGSNRWRTARSLWSRVWWTRAITWTRIITRTTARASSSTAPWSTAWCCRCPTTTWALTSSGSPPSWYAMLGTGANNQLPGNSPFADLSFDNWSYLFEFGLTPKERVWPGPGQLPLAAIRRDGRTASPRRASA